MSASSPVLWSFLTSPTRLTSRAIALALLATSALLATPSAQHQLQPVSALRGRPALELALRKLDTVGSFMMTTAHPDDENNAMLAYFAHGKGFRTTLVTATHGEGGQNEIGPELFEALAVLRTEELAAAHRFDGAEQFFTRAIDFGYSFSVEETLEKWGKEEILGDFVRMIRTVRPDVIVGFVFGGEGGGQHHQTSSLLTFEAFRAAADPARFPEQIGKDGLRPWQPAKVYYTAGFGPPAKPGSGPRALPGEGAPSLLMFDGGDQFDPALGRTYNEIGGESRSMHKCQGMSQLLPLPMASGGPMGMGGGPRAYRLRDTVLDDGVGRSDPEIFSGVDTSLTSLVRFAGAQPPDALRAGLTRIGNAAAEARRQLASGEDAAVVGTLARGLAAVQQLRAELPALGVGESGAYEIGFRLQQKEQQFSEALVVAADVRLDAIARDGLVIPGQSVNLDLLAANRGQVPVGISVQANGLALESADACAMPAVAAGGRLQCSRTARIAADARLTAAHFRAGTEGARYVFDPDVPFGLPFRPTPYTARFSLTVDGVTASVVRPIEWRSEGNIFSGEKRAELHVVPTFSVSASPDVVIAPLAASTRAGAGREVRVTVVHHGTGAASAQVALDTPAGWQVAPASAPVSFSREDEAMTVRFRLTPPAGVRVAGAQTIKARVTAGAAVFDRGYQTVEYPHTTRRHVLREPVVSVKSMDLQVKPNLSVGYVMGVGDEVPEALEQIGAKVELIDPDTLAWGDLGRFDVMMTGVRAYERRADLRANAQRLIEYARSGGTVIVNYNKFEFNEAQYGPAPIKVGRERVTDENAPVRLLQPEHQVFTTPNRLSAADWQGWVQERGLYFLDTAQAKPDVFADLLEFDEPFPYNRGAKRGALVEARVGRGRWLYLGIGLWRQLPAGTDGAYRLMANLLSLGQAPGPSATDAARPQGH